MRPRPSASGLANVRAGLIDFRPIESGAFSQGSVKGRALAFLRIGSLRLLVIFIGVTDPFSEVRVIIAMNHLAEVLAMAIKRAGFVGTMITHRPHKKSVPTLPTLSGFLISAAMSGSGAKTGMISRNRLSGLSAAVLGEPGINRDCSPLFVALIHPESGSIALASG